MPMPGICSSKFCTSVSLSVRIGRHVPGTVSGVPTANIAGQQASHAIHSFIHWTTWPAMGRFALHRLLLDHWLCPMRHQRRVLCRLPVVASTDGEAGHVDVSTVACCRGGDQFLPWQPDAVPCGPEWLHAVADVGCRFLIVGPPAV